MLRQIQRRYRLKPKQINLIQDAAAVLVLAAFTVLVAPFYMHGYRGDAPTIDQGEINFSGWDPTDKVVTLQGNWEFYWQATAEDFRTREPEFIYVPALWSDVSPAYPRRGYATYRLGISGLEPGMYELRFPTIYAASNVWLDGKLRSSTGKFGKTSEEVRSVFYDHSVPFESNGEQHEILVEIAAFHHRANGMEVVPQLGELRAIAGSKQLLNSKDMFLEAVLVILSLYGFTIFIFRNDDRASLYFGLFCLAGAVSMLVMGVNLIEYIFPGIAFSALLFILYVPFAYAYAFLGLYVGALYPEERVPLISHFFTAVFCLVGTGHVALLLLGRTMESSLLVPVLGLFSLPFFLYVLSIMLRAAVANREGARVLFFGSVIFLGLLVNDLLVEANILHRDDAFLYGLGEFGVVAFLLTQVMILAGRWSTTLSRSERMATDLSQLIDMSSAVVSDETLPNLLSRIVLSGRQFLNAERGTLYLYDPEADELWSLVAEGVENREIRIPSSQGVAGACFSSGNIIRVDNAYEDKRFLGKFDEETGFTTQTLLCVPIETKSGNRIGVMQVLNKAGEEPFNEEDEEKLVAFASQAAISLENADLFGEINQARRYNDSILTSMSNGVISISKSGQIEKINRAALEIWGGETGNYLGKKAKETIVSGNPWLAAAMDAASIDREVRIFVDVDVVVFDGNRKSANLSVVPLSDADTDMGVLILIEDITGEKRLKGTLARFMTKEVADTILSDPEASLSGSTVTASVLFADLRQYTALTEKLGAQETVAMLNEFFGYMTDVIFSNQGVLDKFIGDSIMAVFGAPIESKQDANNATLCAAGMMQALHKLNQARTARGEPAVSISIGITTGEVVAGTIGSAKRMEYTVIGDSVNLAARLEKATRYYGAEIILSEETVSAVSEALMVRELDLLRVKGRGEPSRIYELLSHHDEQSFPNIDEVLKIYSAGLACYRTRDWAGAQDAFRKALELHPKDRASQIYLERASVFEKTPPAEDWDGVWEIPVQAGKI